VAHAYNFNIQKAEAGWWWAGVQPVLYSGNLSQKTKKKKKELKILYML
jgi:hypothetical protein